MRPRVRNGAFGVAALLVLLGALCAAFVDGVLGEVLTIALMSVGFGGALLLGFLEVGLQEDRDRAREEGERRKRAMLGFGSRGWLRGRPGGRPRRPS